MAEKRRDKDQRLEQAKDLSSWSQWRQSTRRTLRRLKEDGFEMLSNLELWRGDIHVIEGMFGTGILSYFSFLRFLVLLNFIMFLLMFGFVMLPIITAPHASGNTTFNHVDDPATFHLQCPKHDVSTPMLHSGYGDLSPWRCSVLLMVGFVTLVPALCRSFTRSSRVVLGFLLTVLEIILTPRGEILRGAPDRGRLSVVLYVFHFLIIAPTVDFFKPSCLPIADSIFPAWCRSTILFLVSFDSSLVLAIVEFGV
ncbi:unnamed protein product [Oncorhynchus mykiss]|uniref:Uncharacterized protein n=1 Tax=Oncorhynchus mykiss TaxID=8022 RepID=A0A060XVT7_ONCMY|nr:unnamed protein product [Oncorhynchus mykiss]